MPRSRRAPVLHQVVEVRRDRDDIGHRDRRTRGADHDTQQVRPRTRVPGSCPIAHSFQLERWELAERIRDEAAIAAPVGVTISASASTPTKGAPSSNASTAGPASGSSREWTRWFHARDRGADDSIDPERVEQRDRADDVDQRVDATQFVEHEVLFGDAGPRLRGDQSAQGLEGPIANRGYKVRRGDEREELTGPTIPRRSFVDHDDRCCDRMSRSAFDLQLDVREPQPIDDVVHELSVRPRIEQRGHQHVARESAATVDIGDARHSVAAARERATRAATEPARARRRSRPRRASAQEQSIACSAVSPPRAEPCRRSVGTPIRDKERYRRSRSRARRPYRRPPRRRPRSRDRGAPAPADANPQPDVLVDGHGVPSSSARILASCTTGPSEVPAETIRTCPRLDGSRSPRSPVRARARRRRAAACERRPHRASARVTRTLEAPAAASATAIRPPAPGSCPSRGSLGAPWRSSRCVSTRANPKIKERQTRKSVGRLGRLELTLRDGCEQSLQFAAGCHRSSLSLSAGQPTRTKRPIGRSDQLLSS